MAGLSPYYIAAAGTPGSLAAMATHEALPWFNAVTTANTPWVNRVAARIALTYGTYRPVRSVHRILCPTLYCIGEQDQRLAPAKLAQTAAARTPAAEVEAYPCDHFGMYTGELWERVVADQTAFLVRHLEPAY